MQCLKPVFMSLFNVRPIVLSFGPGMRIANISKIAGDKSDSSQYQEEFLHILAREDPAFLKLPLFFMKSSEKDWSKSSKEICPGEKMPPKLRSVLLYSEFKKTGLFFI